MSNRNFDFSSIVKILNAQNNANFYNRQQTVVQATFDIPYRTELQQFNPQTGNYDADTITTLQAGQQAYYFKGLPITTVLAPQQFTTTPTCIPNDTNLVQNGDFATGDFSEWDLQGADPFPENNIIITTSSSPTPLPSPAPAVYGYAAGNIGSNATLTQNISTTVGQTYTLSYYLYGGLSAATATAYFSASVSNTPITGSIKTYTSPPDNPGFGWTPYSFVFTASSISTPLTFTTRHDVNFFYLTNISVTATCS